jgi:tRNA A37 threonylcarbamoyladenosine dehydratase
MLGEGESQSNGSSAPQAELTQVSSDAETHRRFDRMARLIGEPALELLLGSHVMVIGLGGVGSFAAEALARSGIGRLSLVDFDKVCVTNTNRQLQALTGNMDRLKSDALAERLSLVNPGTCIQSVPLFYSKDTAQELLGRKPDFVVDAVDNITAKCHLLATCRAARIPLISSLGAAGRADPSQIAVADVADTIRDPMGRVIRKILRQKYEFPHSGPFGITAVYSTEVPHEPKPVTYDAGLGPRGECPGASNPYHSSEKRHVIYGTAVHVTGMFGLYCASEVVRQLTSVTSPRS